MFFRVNDVYLYVITITYAWPFLPETDFYYHLLFISSTIKLDLLQQKQINFMQY